MSNARPRARKINPSTKLGADNSEPPVLSSHRKSLADKAAADAALATFTSAPAPTIPDTRLEAPANEHQSTSATTPQVPASLEKESSPENASQASAKPTATGKRKATVEDCDDVDDAGLYKDVEVIDIDSEPEDTSKNKKPKRDLDEFFEAPQRIKGMNKPRRRCKTCWNGTQCAKQEVMLVNEHTTLRRHMASKHKAVYQKWCKSVGFLSMLPDDARERKLAAFAESKTEQTEQTHVNSHFRTLEPGEKPVPYSDDLFREAAVQWLIETDQPVQAFEHPAFKNMINIAARATRGVKLPDRRQTREAIVKEFKNQMKRLKERLSSKFATSDISLTCDAWQASNADSYFAVTGHWIEEREPGKWVLQHALFGFTRMNTAHNGKRLGQALYKICDRLGIVHRIGHITCDNAANNNTMVAEFALRYKAKTGRTFDIKRRHIRCLAHIINLATQALISTRSKTKYFNPHQLDEHMPETSGEDRDELGLIRAISVKERSSSQRKDMFKSIQKHSGVTKPPVQLLLDMKVRWGSSYVMLNRAESLREHVDMFVYKLSTKAETPDKRKKIEALRLSDEEWDRVGIFCSLLGHADKAQQAFSSARVPTLFNAIPAIESLHAAWNNRSQKSKYIAFHPALNAASVKLNEYYEKTADSDAHIFAMLLHPTRKMNYFKKHWDHELQDEVITLAKEIFKERYEALNKDNSDKNTAAPPRKKRKANGLLRTYDTDTDDEDDDEDDTSANPSQPWMAEFERYLNTADILPEGMSIIEWWGINAHRYRVWASLARDYLAIMASSVSSERAFSSAGITISKRRNRLKGDIVEALQCLKCMYHNDLIFRRVDTSVEEEEYLEEDVVDELVDDEGSFSWDKIIVDDVADSENELQRV